MCWNHSQYSILRSGSSSFISCSSLGMYTFHFACFRMRLTLDRLTSLSRNPWFTDFCGDRTKYCNTAALDAGLVAVRGWPDLPLWTSLKFRQLRICCECGQLLDALVAVFQTLCHCHCTSFMFSYFQYHFGKTLHSTNNKWTVAIVATLLSDALVHSTTNYERMHSIHCQVHQPWLIEYLTLHYTWD